MLHLGEGGGIYTCLFSHVLAPGTGGMGRHPADGQSGAGPGSDLAEKVCCPWETSPVPERRALLPFAEAPNRAISAQRRVPGAAGAGEATVGGAQMGRAAELVKGATLLSCHGVMQTASSLSTWPGLCWCNETVGARLQETAGLCGLVKFLKRLGLHSFPH